MRLQLVLALSLAAISFPIANLFGESPKLGTSFTSDAGKYRVTMPASVSNSSKDYAAGKWILKITTDKCTTRDAVLAVTFTDYPADFEFTEEKKLIDGVRDGIKGIDGKVTVDKDTHITGSKQAGREVQIEAGKTVIRARIYLVGRRLYQMTVTGTKDSVKNEAADEFFKSFTLSE
jgi:hypothetical protein